MHEIYKFVSGPLVWLAFIIFVGGSLYRLISMAILAKKKDGLIYEYFSLRYAFRSIYHWLIPFGSRNSQQHPWLTLVTFAFHVSLIFTPLFLLAHIILIKESWDISWWFLPEGMADFLTIVVMGGCIFFGIRRIVRPEVRYLTSASDFIILALVGLPFITGFWSFHQWPGATFMGILHIFSGEVLLVMIPFTRLSHMIFFPFTRGYIGSEFGAVRNVKDW